MSQSVRLKKLTWVDRATSEFLPGAEPDWTIFMEVCDMIRSREVPPREAMRSIKRRLVHPNPNVQLLSLRLLDAAIKNGGQAFLQEVASRELVDCLALMVRGQWGELALTEDHRQPVLELARSLMQTWALLFMPHPDLQYMHAVYEEMTREGIPFPPPPADLQLELVESAAPAEWRDSDRCERCRTPFSLTLRKHHCRRCGGCFCHGCSSKQATLPELGIIQLVRVCEACHVAHSERRRSSTRKPPETRSEPPKSHVPVDDDEDFKKAIELSLREAQQARPLPPQPADEERLVAAAIAASLQETPIQEAPIPQSSQPGIFLTSGASVETASSATPSTAQVFEASVKPSISTTTVLPLEFKTAAPLEYISSAERENVRLFSELMQKLCEVDFKAPIGKDDPDLQALAQEMLRLRDRLKKGQLLGQIPPTSDLDRLMSTLEEAIGRFDSLPAQPTAAPLPPPLQPTKLIDETEILISTQEDKGEVEEEKPLIEL